MLQATWHTWMQCPTSCQRQSVWERWASRRSTTDDDDESKLDPLYFVHDNFDKCKATHTKNTINLSLQIRLT